MVRLLFSVKPNTLLYVLLSAALVLLPSISFACAPPIPGYKPPPSELSDYFTVLYPSTRPDSPLTHTPLFYIDRGVLCTTTYSVNLVYAGLFFGALYYLIKKGRMHYKQVLLLQYSIAFIFVISPLILQVLLTFSVHPSVLIPILMILFTLVTRRFFREHKSYGALVLLWFALLMLAVAKFIFSF